KPENIFLVRDPEVAGGERAKILDFGIAKLADSRVKTLAAAVMGTPAFMSPEQCRGAAHVDARTDIYALGCVLFMLLTGRLPFDASGSGDMLVKHITAAPPRASQFAYVPPAVDTIIAYCLDKDPRHRPATGHDLPQALVAFLRWSTTHAGAACPTGAELGFPRFAVTCTDQPADQIVGVVAPGPDGVLGTSDDVPSWTVPSLAALVAGPRWAAR